MKRISKRIVTVVLALAMVITAVPSLDAYAASPKIQKEVKLRIYDQSGLTISSYLHIENPVQNGKITKIKNTDSSVAEVTENGGSYLIIKGISEGTAKVTFRYAGKKLSTKITVKKWESPCKSFKIGNKNYAKYFEKSGHYNLNNQKRNKSEKITIVPKKGWKVTKIEKLSMMGSSKKIKNNVKVKFSVSGTGTGIYVYFKNVNTKEKCRLYFGYSNAPMPSGNIYDSFE